ncbi:MAG: hypothetical protein CMN93_07730 [Synechococcus sp. CPC35]|nr:hypothetical protein [Synechococcus sp. CPC35]
MPVGKEEAMWPMQWDVDILCAASTVSFVAVLAIVARSIDTSGGGDAAAQSAKGRDLLSQSTEWLRLSEQDGVPLFAYRHCAFALAYLNAARLVAPDTELQRFGVDVHLLATKLETRLATLSKKITKTCAPANPQTTKSTNVSWL